MCMWWKRRKHNIPERLRAAYQLLIEQTTSRQKITTVLTLVRGTDPRIDVLVTKVEEAVLLLDKIQEGDVIMLAADALPETNEREERRKKVLMFFTKSWRELGSEISRIQSELHHRIEIVRPPLWRRFLSFIKWPLLIIALVAIAVMTLEEKSVEITIQNKGCSPLSLPTTMPAWVPGFSLPEEPIVSGVPMVIRIPGLKVHVNGMPEDSIVVQIILQSITFQLPPSISSITFDGMSLIGKQRTIALFERPQHNLIITCK